MSDIQLTCPYCKKTVTANVTLDETFFVKCTCTGTSWHARSCPVHGTSVDDAAKMEADLATCRRLLQEACDNYTDACVVMSEDGKYSIEYGVAIVGDGWYKAARAAGGDDDPRQS